MTSSNGDNQDDQAQWEAVLSGERLPVKHSESEQEADAIRQVLIWRDARQLKPTQTPEDAAAFYEHLRRVQQQRKRATYFRWLKIGIVAAALLALIGGALWYLLNNKTISPDSAGGSAGLSASITPQSSFTSPAAQETGAASQSPAVEDLPLIPELVAIPAGSFAMGCTAGWDDSVGGCRANEFPAQQVDVQAFRLGRHEVTRGQFRHFINETNYLTIAEQKTHGCSVADPQKPGSWIIDPALNWRRPGFKQTDSHPVVCISWKDTQQYLAWLNQKTQNQYRLPSEAEWEYAARAGRVTAIYWGSKGNQRFANYQDVAADDKWVNTAPVGRYVANDFGLHDMSGNAWEWTASCWRASYQMPEPEDCKGNGARRVRRGGGWDNSPPSIRSAYRSSGSEIERSYLYGFRVAHDY